MRLALAALSVVLLASLGGTTAAADPDAEPTAQVVGNVKINKDGTGTVKAHYICPEGEDWHLWVSAKQTADGSRDDAISQGGSGYGQVAATWLQQHPTTYVCNGKWQTQKFTIDKEEVGWNGQKIGRGELVKGDAWVQFCLINEPAGLFLIDQDWTKVR